MDAHSAAQHVDITILLRESIGEGFPFIPSGSAAVNAELAVGREMFRVALDWDDEDSLRFVGMDRDWKTEIRGQIAAHFAPGIAPVIASHHVPMLLHKEDIRPR